MPRSTARNPVPSCMSIARSIALRNSRMFAGQVWACNADQTSFLKSLDRAALTVVNSYKVLRQRQDIVSPIPEQGMVI